MARVPASPTNLIDDVANELILDLVVADYSLERTNGTVVVNFCILANIGDERVFWIECNRIK